MRTTWLVVGALVLTGCTSLTPGGGSDGPRAEAGQVITARLSSDIEGRHSVVVVPGRRYDFTVSTPRDRIDQISADDAQVSADGGDAVRFVSLTWDLEGQQGYVPVMNVDPDTHPQLTVVADGVEYPVGALDQDGVHGVHVAVPAEADRIGYVVEFDGLEQTVEDAYDPVLARGDGPDALYLDVPLFPYADCPGSRLERARPFYVLGAECVVRTSSPLPYVGELGWADPGRAFVVVELSARPMLAGYDGPAGSVRYEVEPTGVRLSLEGAGRPRLFPTYDDHPVGLQDDGSWEARAIFEVPDTSNHAGLRFRRLVIATATDPDRAREIGAPLRVRRVYSGRL